MKLINLNDIRKEEKKLYDKILKTLNSSIKASKLLSKLYNIKENTLLMHFNVYVKTKAQSFVHEESEYLKILRDFHKKYNSPSKIKNIYFETIYAEDDYVPLVEALNILKPNILQTQANIHKIKRIFADKIIKSNRKGVKDLILKETIYEMNTESFGGRSYEPEEEIWKKVIKLKNELLPYFKSGKQLAQYVAKNMKTTDKQAYASLFFHAKRRAEKCKRVSNASKYLAALRKIKYKIKNEQKESLNAKSRSTKSL